MERVQKRMTKLVPELQKLDYEERCERLELTTLERRERGDLIETYKILKGIENVDYKTSSSTVREVPGRIYAN